MLKRATLILVLDKGRIVQRGTHEELMRQPGYYFDSVAMQTGGELVSP
jgi:ATP-binding cassette subfamily B protein